MTSQTVEAKPLHASRWAELPERGTPALLRLTGWVALRIGRSFARLLLYPIAFYFLVTGRVARNASREYLTRVTGRRAGLSDVFRHFHCFAATILDRIYLLKGQFDRFDVTVHNKEILDKHIESGKGCILLGSHLGSFEVLRTIGVTQKEFPLKVLMDTVHNERLTVFLDALNEKIANTVIVSDRPDILLRVRESLEAGYLIGILGDRPTSDGKTTRADFLGAPATFPAGPVLLAAMMHCPIVLFFGIYHGSNRYDIFFEELAGEVSLSRERWNEEVQPWIRRYVQRLEHYAKLAPLNWFNFYPFWD